MAVRRLINMIDGLAANKDVRAVRGDQQLFIPSASQQPQDFLMRGRVESASQDAVIVSTDSGSGQATLATDENLQAGQPVWVVKADDGTLVVLGSIS